MRSFMSVGIITWLVVERPRKFGRFPTGATHVSLDFMQTAVLGNKHKQINSRQKHNFMEIIS